MFVSLWSNSRADGMYLMVHQRENKTPAVTLNQGMSYRCLRQLPTSHLSLPLKVEPRL